MALGAMGVSAIEQDKAAALDAESAPFALKALKLIEAGKETTTTDAAGKAVVSWSPFIDKANAVAGLNYALGRYALRAKKPQDAAAYLYAVASKPNKLAKESVLYVYLAEAYADGYYFPYTDEAIAATNAKPGSAQAAKFNHAKAKMEAAHDLMIDAYARVVALAVDPKYDKAKPVWANVLTEHYKIRHNESTVGLKELLDNVLSKPLPSPPSNKPAVIKDLE